MYANGEEYTGTLNEDKQREGYGIHKYLNGSQYCGDFVKDKRDGKGLIKLKNGDNINGVWKDDLI